MKAVRSLSFLTPGKPALMETWLAAAQGELATASEDADAAHIALDRAADLLPAEADDLRPYLVLSESHLARWRGNRLAPGPSKAAVSMTGSEEGCSGVEIFPVHMSRVKELAQKPGTECWGCRPGLVQINRRAASRPVGRVLFAASLSDL